MPREITARELAKQLANGRSMYLLDVRLPWEHAIAAIPDSVLIPLQELSRRIDDVRPALDAQVVVYCHHGVRSLTAGAFLERAGFTNVLSLAGGIDAWSEEVDPSVERY